MTRIGAALVIVLVAAGGARAHGRSVSYSTWELLPTGARVVARIARLDLSRLGPEGLEPAVAAYVAAHLRLAAGDRPCEPAAPPRQRPAASGWASWEWEVTCPGGGTPIELLVKRGTRYLTVPVAYHGGLRWPWLERAGSGEQGLDRLLAPRAR